MGMVVDQDIEQVAQDLPEEKQHQEIGARHHAEEDEDGDAEHGEVSTFVGLLIHVVDGIGIDDCADRGDQDHHDGAEPIDVEAEGYRNRKGSRGIVKPDTIGPCVTTA